MWIDIEERPIPTYGKHGKEFLLSLKFKKYYGRDTRKTGDIVIGVWDSIDECFFEKVTRLPIDDREIVQWAEIKN